MEALSELKPIATINGNRTSLPRAETRKVRQKREREQLQEIMRTAYGSDIQSN